MAYYSPYQLVLLSKLTATSSATISFTSLITSKFVNYKIQIRGLVAATDATDLTMLMSTDNGGTYLNANYQYSVMASSSTGAGLLNSNSASSILVSNITSNVSSQSLSSDIYLFGLNSSTYKPKYFGRVGKWDSNSNPYDAEIGGSNDTTTPVNAIRFLMSSGDIASGTFALYGIRET